ncbi:MAG: hypothetical protein Q7U54_18610 [Bacteroidales bacterium]|nr:hypothetical protein [Bacteroidales bacterium]
MKKVLQYSFLTAFLVFATTLSLNAQPHAGQQDGSTPVVGGRIGAGAPVGSGTFILLTLAVAYASRKVYVARSEEDEVA